MLLGIGGYQGSGHASVTALIPAAFGVPLVLLGLLARSERYRMHAMHGAVLLGLLGVLGTLRGVFRLPSAFAGTLERPFAVYAQSAMAVLCAAFVALCVRSFIAARRARG